MVKCNAYSHFHKSTAVDQTAARKRMDQRRATAPLSIEAYESRPLMQGTKDPRSASSNSRIVPR